MEMTDIEVTQSEQNDETRYTYIYIFFSKDLISIDEPQLQI